MSPGFATMTGCGVGPASASVPVVRVTPPAVLPPEEEPRAAAGRSLAMGESGTVEPYPSAHRRRARVRAPRLTGTRMRITAPTASLAEEAAQPPDLVRGIGVQSAELSTEATYAALHTTPPPVGERSDAPGKAAYDREVV
ncbi:MULTISPECIES: hypothetical protein [unclassified Streptomyces]|uniref:hypothetical protein n=1 Tax=unclassified Streptomyces TaxID=2593676 RepID=UPI003D74FEDF